MTIMLKDRGDLAVEFHCTWLLYPRNCWLQGVIVRGGASINTRLEAWAPAPIWVTVPVSIYQWGKTKSFLHSTWIVSC